MAIDVLVRVLKYILDRDMRSPHDRIYIIESYDSLVCLPTFAICNGNGNVNDNSNSMNCMSKYSRFKTNSNSKQTFAELFRQPVKYCAKTNVYQQKLRNFILNSK